MTVHTEPMPAWLVQRLDRAGYIDATLAASRRARAAYCPRCRHIVMRGLDADWCALTVDCDPTPITAQAEALALLTRIPTFEVRWLGDRYEIDRRDQWRIKERPAGITPGIDVLVLHRCGEPARWPHAGSQLVDTTVNRANDLTDPPF